MANTSADVFEGVLELHRYTGQEAIDERVYELCQPIGHAAWTAGFRNRTTAEIDHVYGEEPYRQAFTETMSSMGRERENLSRTTLKGAGVLLVARLPEQADGNLGKAIGYIMVRHNTSGSWLKRVWKTHVAGRLPYAWVQSLNVLPEYQGRGVGSVLLDAGLNDLTFGRTQPATAYAFEENRRAIEFFERRDLHKSMGSKAAHPEPKPIRDYFGTDTRPVEQCRMATTSAELTLRRIASRARECNFTMPEYAIVDHSYNNQPPPGSSGGGRARRLKKAVVRLDSFLVLAHNAT